MPPIVVPTLRLVFILEHVFKRSEENYSLLSLNYPLDVAKAFNCIDHVRLYKTMRDVGMSNRGLILT